VRLSALLCRLRPMMDVAGMAIALRPVRESDLDGLFDQMRDPESVWMAAFTPDDPDDRQWFSGHIAKLLASPDITLRAVEGQTEVTYWIDRAAWGRGIASRALALFLEVVRGRPLYARAASDNAASLRVLEKAGFRVVDTELSFAPARSVDIEEKILRLD
jgi:RimJ/RimL family protein N-acetyltransferase